MILLTAATATTVPAGQSLVAVTAIIVTGMTAMLGLAVQMWLLRSTQQNARRKDRYEELMSAYSSAGQSMSAGTHAVMHIVEEVIAGLDGGKLPDRDDVAARLDKEPLSQYRHLSNMLRLHGASSEVLDAVGVWSKHLERLVSTPTEMQGKLAEDAKQEKASVQREIEDSLRAFYVAAGVDARQKSGVAA